MSAHGDKPSAAKQFLTIGGVPVLVHCLRAFDQVSRVAEVLVAVRAIEMDRVTELISRFGLSGKVRVVEGGENRQASVANALEAIPGNDDDVILVHDAVRPLIDAAIIDRTIDAVEKHGAAIVGTAGSGHNQAGRANSRRSHHHGDDPTGTGGAGAGHPKARALAC